MDEHKYVTRSRYERERKARESAELLLEQKSRELYDAVQRLGEQAADLTNAIDEKTKDLNTALTKALAAAEKAEKAELALREREYLFRTLVENANDIVFTLDTNGAFSYLSPRITDVLGYRADELLHQHFSSVIHPDDLHDCNAFFSRLISEKKPNAGLEYRVKHKDGTWHWHDTNATPLFAQDQKTLLGMLGIGRDVNDKKDALSELQYLANHDSMTGLQNRSSILRQLDHYIKIAHTKRSKLAVLFLDIDRFKDINDTHGHHAGDEVLQAVAERLKSSLRKVTDAVGRIAGDEFLIVLPEVSNLEESIAISKRVKNAVGRGLYINDATLMVSCSIGISMYPDDANSTDALVRVADSAMYQDKPSHSKRLAK